MKKNIKFKKNELVGMITAVTENKIEKDKVHFRQQILVGNVSYHDRIICAQAHWFIYSLTSPTLEIFRYPYFKSMLMSIVPLGTNTPKNVALTIPLLKKVIEALW